MCLLWPPGKAVGRGKRGSSMLHLHVERSIKPQTSSLTELLSHKVLFSRGS